MFTQGPLPAAKQEMERALAIADDIGDVEGRVRCLRLIGVHQVWTGDHDLAIRTLDTMAALAAAEVPTAVLEAETARGITEASLKTGVPLLFGVITADNVEQANARAGARRDNKGYDVAMAAVEVVNLYRNRFAG